MSGHLVAICADLHCGSTIGLCHKDPTELDDGGLYRPSEGQKYLFQCWEEGWATVKSMARRRRLHFILNGDAIDGDHHQTPQLASRLSGTQVGMALKVLETPLALKPSAIHIMRGTPVHTGSSAQTEEGIARTLAAQGHPVIKDPDIHTYSSYRRRIDIEGVRLDVAHHGRAGTRAHTRGSMSKLYAYDVWGEQALTCLKDMQGAEHMIEREEIYQRKRPCDIAIRSHNHKYMDSGFDSRGVTRVIGTPAFQLATEYIYKLAAEALADLGILCLKISKSGKVSVHPILFEAKRSTVIKGS